MKPAPFDYVLARSVDHAVATLAAAPGARLIAGGQALMPLLTQRAVRPPLLVDVGRLPDLRGCRVDGQILRIGAATTLRELERSDAVRWAAPALSEAAALVGPVHVRNRGTVGGSLAHADPAAEVPAALVAHGATARLSGPEGERVLPVAELPVGAHRTSLDPAEVLTSVEIPLAAGGLGGAFREFATREGDLPLAGVACVIRADATGACLSASLVACGVADRPVTLRAAELLSGVTALDEAVLARVAAAAGDELDPPGDARSTAEHRRELACVLVAQAVATAWRSAASERPAAGRTEGR